MIAGPHRWLLVVVLVAAAIVPYLGSLDAELVWDDRMLIGDELRFYSPAYVVEIFAQGFFQDIEQLYRYGYYRPLVSLSYYLTWKLVGDQPMPYHLTNLVLHAATTIALFAFVLALFPGRHWRAFTAALLFAVHPAHSESVAWVAGRTDVLSGLLVLVAALALLHARTAKTGIDGTGGWRRPLHWLSLTCFGLALFAKEAVAFWPLALILFALTQGGTTRRWWYRSGVLAAAAAAPYLVVRMAVAHAPPPGMQWSAAELPSVIATFFASFARYLAELVLPVTPEPYMVSPLVSTPLDPRFLAGVAFFAGACWLIRVCRRRHPESAFLLVLFLTSFAPISNLIRLAGPVDMGAPMAERFLYIPSMAFCALLGWGVGELTQRWPRRQRVLRPVVAAAILAATLLLGVQAARATEMWHDEERLFETMVRQAPGCSLPNFLLGTAYCRAQRWTEGITALREAQSLQPRGESKIAVANNLAGALAASGRRDEARALILEVRNDSRRISSVEFNLAMTYLLDNDLERALRFLDSALAANPWHPQALLKRARILIDRREIARAERDLDRYASRYGHSAESLMALAHIAGLAGREQEAVSLLRQAHALDPSDIEVANMLGSWALSVHRWDEARAVFERALADHPGHPVAAVGTSTALSGLGQQEDAVGVLERSLSINGGSVEVLIALAELDLERGEPERASRWLAEARQLAPDDQRVVDLAARFESTHPRGE